MPSDQQRNIQRLYAIARQVAITEADIDASDRAWAEINKLFVAWIKVNYSKYDSFEDAWRNFSGRDWSDK